MTAAVTASPTIARADLVSTRSPGRRRGRAGLPGYVFVAPGFLAYGLVVLWPALQALVMSFQQYKLRKGLASPFIGWANYARAIQDPVVLRSFANSAFYVLVTVPPQLIIGLVLAILLDKAMPARTFFRVLFYLPVITSWVVVSLLFKWLFATDDGVFNWILTSIGLVSHNVDWLGQRWTAMLAVSLLGIWKGVGWSMLILLASLAGVSEDLHEAAAIDGAGTWRRFLYVTLPHIRGTVVTITILLVMGGLNVFPSILLMTGGGPADATQVPLTYIYKQAFTFLDFGYGAALSYLLAFFVVVISLLQYGAAKLVERRSE
ncbi:MAG: sugar ABC transporter permease [Actinobacteria bacterium]|nr:sugar ABC transporter permease [Actinomycetota bacterium]